MLRALSMCMSRWREYIQIRRRMCRLLARVKHSALYGWFSLWQRACGENRRQKALLRRFLARAKNMTLHRSFSQWDEFAVRRRRLRQRIIVMVRRWISSKLRFGVVRWKAWIAAHIQDENESQRKRIKCARIMARVRNRLLLGYWQSWLGVLSKKRKLRQFVQKMRNQRLLVWFNTWIECLDEMQRQHCLLQRSLARVLKATLSRSFDEWEDATRKRIRLRRFMKLALRRWVLAKKRRGIAQWKNHNRIMRICQKEEAARKISAKRIFSRYVHREMASRFDTWIDMVMQRRMLRGLVKKIQNSRMLMWFHSWSDGLTRLKRERNLMHRSLQRVIHARMSRCFGTWEHNAAIQVRLRKRMQLAVRRWTISRLTHGWRVWTGRFLRAVYAEEDQRARQRRSAKRLMARYVHRQLARRFDAWTDMVQMKGKMRRFLARMHNVRLAAWFETWLDGVYKMQRNRKLVQRCLSRAINAQKHRCVRQWVAFVATRRRLRKRMKVACQRWTVAKMRNGWSRWQHGVRVQRGKAQEEQHRQNSARRIMQYALNRTLVYCFDTWSDAVLHGKRLRGIVRRMLSRRLSASFNSWFEQIHLQREMRRRIKGSITRARYRTVARCMDTWQAQAECRKLTRRRISVAAHRWRQNCLRTGWDRWSVRFLLQARLEAIERARMERSSKRIFARIVRRALFWRFDSWRNAVYKRLRLKRFMKRMASSRLFRWWNTWVLNLEDVKRKKSSIARGLLRQSAGKVGRAFARWEEFMQVRHKLRSMMRNRVHRWSSACYRQGWERWMRFVMLRGRELAEEQVKRSRCKKILARMSHRALSGCFNTWQGRVKSRRKLVQFMKRMKNAELLKSFASWADQVEDVKRQRLLVQRSLSRVLNAKLYASFNRWDEFRCVRITLRKRMVLALGRWKAAQSRRGIMVWKEYVRTAREEAQDEARRKRSAKRMLARCVHRAMAAHFDRWTDMLAERRRLRQFLLRMKMLRASQALDAWRSNVVERKKQKMLVARGLRRALNRALAVAWDSWSEHCSNRKRLRTMMQLATHRWSSAKLRYGFRIWSGRFLHGARHAEREDIARRRRAIQILRKIQNSHLTRCMNRWVGMVAESRRLRRFFLRIKFRAAAKCFETWTSMVQESKNHRAIVAKFLNRVQNSGAVRSIQTWREFVATRVSLRARVRISVHRWVIGQFNWGLQRWKAFVRKLRVADITRADRRRNHVLRLKSMVRVARQAGLRRGFRRWVDVFCSGHHRAEQIRMHLEKMETVESRVKKDMGEIRARVKSFRANALAHLLHQNGRLVRKLALHSAFLRWKSKADCSALVEEHLFTQNVLTLERAAHRRRSERARALQRGFRNWHALSVKVGAVQQDRGRRVIATSRYAMLKSSQSEQLCLGTGYGDVAEGQRRHIHAVRDLILRGAFRKWEQNWDSGSNKDQRRKIQVAVQQTRSMKHLARTLTVSWHRWMLQRRARMFYAWSKRVAELRERECEERINELREMVFKQSKAVETGIVAIVRERLVNSYRKASVAEDVSGAEEGAEEGAASGGSPDIATTMAGLRDRILAWKDAQQESHEEDTKTNDSAGDVATGEPEVLTVKSLRPPPPPTVETRRPPPKKKLFPHPYYDGVPTPSRLDDGSLLSLPQYQKKFSRR